MVRKYTTTSSFCTPLQNLLKNTENRIIRNFISDKMQLTSFEILLCIWGRSLRAVIHYRLNERSHWLFLIRGCKGCIQSRISWSFDQLFWLASYMSNKNSAGSQRKKWRTKENIFQCFVAKYPHFTYIWSPEEQP